MKIERTTESLDRSPSTVAETNRPARSVGSQTMRPLLGWIALVLFGVLWLDLLKLLSYQWDVLEQYSYGWLVPFFAAALFWRRWQDKPAPEKAKLPAWLLALLLMPVLLLVPSRVVYEINPDWPLVSWFHTAAVVTASVLLLLAAGGWKWVRHFAFPVAFIFVAVVWPYRIEKGLTQGLMQVVASLTVEILGWFNIAAYQRGNLIEISTGVLGVDEACSGIRSFQSSIMAGLFMGELYRMRVWARGVLLISGAVLAFCFNVGRAFWLSYQANAEGIQAVDKYHDTAGFTILVISFFCLWGLAVLIQKLTGSPGGVSPEAALQSKALSPALPNWQKWAFGIGCWAVFSLAASEAWYRLHEVSRPGYFHWTANPPENRSQFTQIELPERTVKMLSYNSGESVRWNEPDGSEWTMFFFRWEPTSVQNLITARIHRPEVCLPASGMRLVEDAGMQYYEALGLKLPVRQYVYALDERLFFVFFCQWEDGKETQQGLWGDETRHLERLRTALSGRRMLGQQTLELIITDLPDLTSAQEKLRENLPNLIKRN